MQARTVLKHVENTLHGEEAVRLLLLAQAVEEDGEVVVVVELLDVDLSTRARQRVTKRHESSH